jgi:excisionase family DNA binding protein
MTRTKTKRGSFGLKPLLSVDEAAIMLGITRSTAYRAIKNGSFPVQVFKVGGHLCIARVSIERLLNGEDPMASWAIHKFCPNCGEKL